MNLIDAAYGLSIGPHYLWHRYVTGKYGPKTDEKTGRVPDRFRGSATAVLGKGDPHFEQPCMWLHSVSVGETLAARDLAKMFVVDNPRWEMRVSTTTATGRALAEKEWGASNVFYYPLDFTWMVRRAFDNIRPNLIVLMELEIWPNFLAEAVRREVPVVVANARITERSVKRLSLAKGVASTMAKAVEAWFAQTPEYAERLERIGVPQQRIEVTGSVKYDSIPAELDMETAMYYRRLFGCGERAYVKGGDLLIVAGSTHPGEEKLLLDAIRSLPERGKSPPRIVLTPRHPERLDEVEALAKQYGTVIRRSALPEPMPTQEKSQFEGNIILVDTLGELAKMYSAADVVFVGGTCNKHGGQNFMEPCGLAKPTLVGPYLWNFKEPADLLCGAEAIRKVSDPSELAGALRELLAHPAQMLSIGKKAREVLLQQRGATRRMGNRLGTLARIIDARGYDPVKDMW